MKLTKVEPLKGWKPDTYTPSPVYPQSIKRGDVAKIVLCLASVKAGRDGDYPLLDYDRRLVLCKSGIDDEGLVDVQLPFHAANPTRLHMPVHYSVLTRGYRYDTQGL